MPVALVAYGFGAGGATDGDGTGSGGGGGGYTLPIGAYVGDSLGVRFQPNPVALLAVADPVRVGLRQGARARDEGAEEVVPRRR